MNLPERFLEVTAISKTNTNRKYSSVLDKVAEKLFIFSNTDGCREYNFNEIQECFTLLNPQDGFEYDLEKVFRMNPISFNPTRCAEKVEEVRQKMEEQLLI